MQPKRLLLTATKAGLGLSSIVKGLLVSLREAGIPIRVDILGDSLLEATHIRRTTGRICQCLAPSMLTNEQILYGYSLSLSACELHILICNDINYLEQNSSFFEQIDPVTVVIFDAEEEKKNNFSEILKVAERLNRYEKIGVIGNLAASDSGEGFETLKSSEKIKLLGIIPRFEQGKFAGDSSLSVNRNPSLITRNQILRLKSLVDNYIIFSDLKELYRQSRDVSLARAKTELVPRCRIAVADDSAFHLSFQDNLNLLREYGAEIKLFSPLAEYTLPEAVDAIYFPNSYLSLYADEFEHNKKLNAQIKESIYSGVLAYFEGNSIAYACSKVIFEEGNISNMLGLVNADMTFFQSENKTIAKFKAVNPSIITDGNEICSGFYTEQVRLLGADEFIQVFELADIQDYNPAAAGISVLSNIFCTSSILHWGSCPILASKFIDLAIKVGKSEYAKASKKL